MAWRDGKPWSRDCVHYLLVAPTPGDIIFPSLLSRWKVALLHPKPLCLSVCRSHHSFPGSLDWTVSDRYLSLPTDKTLATYIWIDATGQVIIFITNVGVCGQFVF